MTRTTEMNTIIEERNNICKYLYLIKKETDKRNNDKRKQGADWKNLTYMNIFALPSHIKILFGPFMKTPLYTELAILKGHTYAVMCLTLHKNKLYSGSCDNTIRIWAEGTNTETHEEIGILGGHTDDVVRCLTIHENKLYSGGLNNTIRIWNTETHEEIGILGGHTDSVWCLTIHENKLYSGSCDNTIRIWNTETHEEIAILRGHTDVVRCLTLHENKLYSGSYDKTIRIWKV